MDFILLLFITILPTLLLWKYVNKLDAKKEPSKVLLKLFFAGIVSALLTVLVSLIIDGLIPGFIDAEITFSFTGFLYIFFGIALIEEGFKFWMTYNWGLNEDSLDETYDTILYCMIVALGFATVENLIYSADGTITTAIFRFFTAVPGHVIDGAFMGYFVYKMKTTQKVKLNLFLAIIVPTITHTIYDFIALTAETSAGILIFMAFVISEFIIALKLVKNISKNSSPLSKKTDSYFQTTVFEKENK